MFSAQNSPLVSCFVSRVQVLFSRVTNCSCQLHHLVSQGSVLKVQCLAGALGISENCPQFEVKTDYNRCKQVSSKQHTMRVTISLLIYSFIHFLIGLPRASSAYQELWVCGRSLIPHIVLPHSAPSTSLASRLGTCARGTRGESELGFMKLLDNHGVSLWSMRFT